MPMPAAFSVSAPRSSPRARSVLALFLKSIPSRGTCFCRALASHLRRAKSPARQFRFLILTRGDVDSAASASYFINEGAREKRNDSDDRLWPIHGSRVALKTPYDPSERPRHLRSRQVLPDTDAGQSCCLVGHIVRIASVALVLWNLVLSGAFADSQERFPDSELGEPFRLQADRTSVTSSGALSRQYFVIRADRRIDAVELLKGRAGGNGGMANPIYLDRGECVTGLTVYAGQTESTHDSRSVLGIKLETNFNTYGPYGRQTTDAKDFWSPRGYEIIGFLGRAGDEIDSLGPIEGPSHCTPEPP